MLRFVSEGNHFDFVNDTAVVIPAGTPIVRGKLFGITKRDVCPGKAGSAMMSKKPIFEVEKENVTDVYEAGDDVHYDPATGKSTLTPSATTIVVGPAVFGWALHEQNFGLTGASSASRATDACVRFAMADQYDAVLSQAQPTPDYAAIGDAPGCDRC